MTGEKVARKNERHSTTHKNEVKSKSLLNLLKKEENDKVCKTRTVWPD